MQQKKKTTEHAQTERHYKILPAVFLSISLLLMLLPLESPIASVKAVLSYIFIPPVRLAHGTVQYAEEVKQTVQDLLNTHRENEQLKEQIRQLQLQNEQAREIFATNERLADALQLRAPKKWEGIWVKTAYREPSQWNSIVIDKGKMQAIQERAAAVVIMQGRAVLAGVVIEVNEHTAKVLLIRDEDFSAAVYTADSKEEGLLTGANGNYVKMRYLPLLSKVQEGEAVYTSAASSIFPAGILVGYVAGTDKEDENNSSLTLQVRPAIESSAIRELFILIPSAE